MWREKHSPLIGAAPHRLEPRRLRANLSQFPILSPPFTKVTCPAEYSHTFTL
jgi:hypothetical protein